jgi:hypothetical protein
MSRVDLLHVFVQNSDFIGTAVDDIDKPVGYAVQVAPEVVHPVVVHNNPKNRHPYYDQYVHFVDRGGSSSPTHIIPSDKKNPPTIRRSPTSTQFVLDV